MGYFVSLTMWIYNIYISISMAKMCSRLFEHLKDNIEKYDPTEVEPEEQVQPEAATDEKEDAQAEAWVFSVPLQDLTNKSSSLYIFIHC